MRIPRLYHPEPLPEQGGEIVLSPEALHHFVRVLRRKAGDSLHLFDGSTSKAFTGVFSPTDQVRARVVLHAVPVVTPVSHLTLELGQGIARIDRFSWILQKATELGVNAICPLKTERTLLSLAQAEIENKRQLQWGKVAISACEQSQRNDIPRIEKLQALTAWLHRPFSGTSICLSPDASLSFGDLVLKQPSVRILIGPEGGFSEEEMSQIRTAGFLHVRMGKRILRTETAAIATIAILQNLFGDLQ